MTKRNTIFFGLNLEKSMKLSIKLIKFFSKFLDKMILNIVERFLDIAGGKKNLYQTSPNFFFLVENFFSKSFDNLSFNSGVFLKQMNRILAIGNLYFLTISRMQKIIANQYFSRNYTFSSLKGRGKDNFFKIFQKKILILSQIYNNSIETLKFKNLL